MKFNEKEQYFFDFLKWRNLIGSFMFVELELCFSF